MAATETGWYRTESGVVLEMDLPLPDGIAQRVAKGEIVRVANAAGDPWQSPDAPPLAPPAEVATLQAELATAQARIAELESEKTDLLAARNRAQEALDAAQARVRELETQLTNVTPAPSKTPAKATKKTGSAAPPPPPPG